MYLDTNSAFALDEIIKKFEVAFRSYVAAEFIAQIPDEVTFAGEIDMAEKSLKAVSFLPAQRYQSKVAGMKGKSGEIFRQVQTAYDAHRDRNYPGEAPYVSTISDIFVLFFDKFFNKKDLLRNFSSSEELLFSVYTYHRLRNTLSHPASSQVFFEDAVTVLKFVRKIVETLSDDFFWFSPRDEILRLIGNFSSLTSRRSLAAENLAQIPLQHRKLFCRSDELGRLHDCVFGKEGYQRVAGSVIVYGYGGVGKTALVVEFIYRTLVRIRDTDNKDEVDFILFYSSKEEFLRRMDTTGEVYIEKVDQQIATFDDFSAAFFADLGVASVGEAAAKYRKGLVVIDNVENLPAGEKDRFFSFIRSTPRNIQFILTSRSEEQCEEKIYIEEYRDPAKGLQFIQEYLEFEDQSITMTVAESNDLLKASKGNTLILVQAINSVMNGVNTISEIVASLEPVRTKDAKIVADFMYKNTFDSAMLELEKKGYNVRDLIVIISLYKESIDLYSIGRLSKIDIGSASEICQYLCRCLILIKVGEYFRLNDFANNFIFIKMLPDRIELEKIKNKISEHKSKIKERIRGLDEKISGNDIIKEMMEDWKPRNYIDKVIIAACFTGYRDFSRAVAKRDKGLCERLLKDFSENEMITDHPYVQYQKAQILAKLRKSGLFRPMREELSKNIERAYEDCIESIEFNYPNVRNTRSHGAVLLFFGAQLLESKDPSRAMRYLEDAKQIISEPTSKLYFDLRYYLARSYNSIFDKTRDEAYLHLRNKTIDEMLAQGVLAVEYNFDINKLRSVFNYPISGRADISRLQSANGEPARHPRKQARKHRG